jgi:hypothetical protein
MKVIKDKWAPLSAGFMLTSILGFLVSIWFISDLSLTWGFTLSLFFIIMFFASFISMTKAEPIPEHMDHLAIHEHDKAYKPFLKKKKLVAPKRGFVWYEPLLAFYFALWLFFSFHFFNNTLILVPQSLFIIFLIFTVMFSIFFLVDIFSDSTLNSWEQAIFSLVIILTVGYGAFFIPVSGAGLLLYYLHLRKSRA